MPMTRPRCISRPEPQAPEPTRLLSRREAGPGARIIAWGPPGPDEGSRGMRTVRTWVLVAAAVLLRGAPRRHPHRLRAPRGPDRPAALLSADRPGPVAPLPLEVHRLLHRDHRVGAAVPVPLQAAARPGRLHRQGPPAPVRAQQ